MTRDEMIERQIKATGFTRVACTGFIDQLAGAGLIELDEPKSAWDLFKEVMLREYNYIDDDSGSRTTFAHIKLTLDRAGLKIVEK